MTNAVDVLLIDGPKHGDVICVKKPFTSAYIGAPLQGIADAVTYTRRQFTAASGKRYHIAQYEGGSSGVSDIEFTIIARNFPPSWDLN